MPATINHVHTATTPDITNLSYDILPQRDWNATHAVTLAPVGSELIGAFSNAGNVSFGVGANGFITATALAIVLSAGTALASQGTVSFGNSNNVSFGISGSTLTASVAALPSLALSAGANSQNSGTIQFVNSNGVTAGMNASGQITFTVQPGAAAGIDGIIAGNQTLTAGTLSFVNSNGMSFSLSGGSNLVGSYTVPAQTVQTQNCVDLSVSGNVAGAGALISSGTAYLGGGPNITISQTGQTLFVSGNPPQSLQTSNLIAGVSMSGNSVGAAALINSGTLYLAGGANVTISQNGNSLSINAAGLGASAIAGIAASNGTYASGTVEFLNGNGVTFGTQTGNAISASVVAQSTAPAAISAAGGAITNGTVSFANSNGVSFGVNGSTVTASIGGIGATFSGGLSNIGNTSGNTGTVSNQLVLAGGNNVTLSGSTAAGGITVTISAAATAPSVGLSAGTQSVNSGTVNFANSNGVSFGMSASSQITASVAAQSAQTLGMFAEVNTTGQSSSLAIDARSLSIAFNGGNLSGGFSNGSLVLSVTQSHDVISAYAVSNTVGGASSSTFNVTALSLAGAGALSLGMSNGSVLFSVPAAFGSGTAFAVNNTTGQSSSSSFALSSLPIAFEGGVSGGWSNGSLVISGAAGGGGGVISVGMSTFGNTAGNTGLVTGQLVLAATGGASLSASTNGGSMSISVGAPQGFNAYAVGNTFSSSSSTIPFNSVSFSALGGVSVGVSGNNVLLSVANTSSFAGVNGISMSTNGQSVSVSWLGLDVSAGTTSASLTALTFSNSNNVSFGLSNGVITATVTGAGGGGLGAISAAGSSVGAGTVVFSNSNNVSFGMNGSTVTGSASFAQSNQTIGIYASSNTTGQSSSSTFDARSITFQGIGAISVGDSAGAVVLSVPAQTAQSMGVYFLDNTTGQSSSSTIDARSISFTLGGGMSGGMTGGSIELSAPGTTSFVGAGMITISTAAGSTVTISAPGQLSFFQALAGGDVTTVTQIGQGSLQMYPVINPQPFSASRADLYASISMSSSSNSSHAGVISVQVGLYTRNGSTLSLASSASQSYGWTDTSGGSFSVVSGLRQLSVPLNANYVNGDLWIGVLSLTSSTNANWFTASNLVAQQGVGIQQLVGLIGQASSNTRQVVPGMGLWSTTSGALPASVAFSAISGAGSSTQGPNNLLAPVNFANVTA